MYILYWCKQDYFCNVCVVCNSNYYHCFSVHKIPPPLIMTCKSKPSPYKLFKHYLLLRNLKLSIKSSASESSQICQILHFCVIKNPVFPVTQSIFKLALTVYYHANSLVDIVRLDSFIDNILMKTLFNVHNLVCSPPSPEK